METGEGENFPSTNWKLIAAISHAQNGEQNGDLEKLLALYAPLLRRYLLNQKRVSIDDVDDIVQDFITDKFIEKRLVDRADKTRGKFRNLLVRALEHFLIDRNRRQHARGRSPADGQVVQLDPDASFSASADLDPARAFDRACAESLIQTALEMTRQHCLQKHREKQWLVFSARILSGSNDPPPSYQQLIERFKLNDPIEASTAMITCKRLFERNLRKLLSHFEILDDAAFMDEVRQLKEIFGPKRAGS